jgi:hypothetical protein
MKFTGKDVIDQFNSTLAAVKVSLSKTAGEGGGPPNVTGLNGWVCEQTVRKCLTQEAVAAGLKYETVEQHKFGGRARLDLVVGNVAIEVKAHGVFGKNDCGKYEKYRTEVEKAGKKYLYVTLWEGHRPFRQMMRDIFGPENAFFVEEAGDWEKFVKAVIAGNA